MQQNMSVRKSSGKVRVSPGLVKSDVPVSITSARAVRIDPVKPGTQGIKGAVAVPEILVPNHVHIKSCSGQQCIQLLPVAMALASRFWIAGMDITVRHMVPLGNGIAQRNDLQRGLRLNRKR